MSYSWNPSFPRENQAMISLDMKYHNYHKRGWKAEFLWKFTRWWKVPHHANHTLVQTWLLISGLQNLIPCSIVHSNTPGAIPTMSIYVCPQCFNLLLFFSFTSPPTSSRGYDGSSAKCSIQFPNRSGLLLISLVAELVSFCNRVNL